MTENSIFFRYYCEVSFIFLHPYMHSSNTILGTSGNHNVLTCSIIFAPMIL